MRMRAHAGVAAALLGVSSPALSADGPYIEIGVRAQEIDELGQATTSVFRATFDASAQPAVLPSFLIFDSVASEGVGGADENEASPFRVEDPTRDDMMQLASAFIRYSPDTQRLKVEFVTVDGDDAELSLHASSAFSQGMTSLPDIPSAFKHSSDGPMSYFHKVGTTWDPDEGYHNGAFVYWVNVVEDPNASEPCGIADLAPPFGILDFADILAYLSAFGAGCP